MQISAATVVNRPVADVFRFVAEEHHQNHPRWDPNVVGLEPLDGTKPGLGARFTITRRLLGREETHEFHYTVWEPRSATAYQTTGGSLSLTLRCDFESVSPTSTRITLSGIGKARGPRAILTPILRRLMTRQLRQNLSRIKAMVEAEAAPSAAAPPNLRVP